MHDMFLGFLPHSHTKFLLSAFTFSHIHQRAFLVSIFIAQHTLNIDECRGKFLFTAFSFSLFLSFFFVWVCVQYIVVVARAHFKIVVKIQSNLLILHKISSCVDASMNGTLNPIFSITQLYRLLTFFFMLCCSYSKELERTVRWLFWHVWRASGVLLKRKWG